jgi:ATP-binding cassette subfamily F protein 3
MIPAIRNILGGFLFSGDDVYKRAGVLSGGERTRLAVARMLLRPSNTLLLDEPTNHLDLDSKEVLLEALVDYGGTLIFVSHDRYFVEKLATKIIEVGHGQAVVYPGGYTDFLWSKARAEQHSTAGPTDRPAVKRANVSAARPQPTARAAKQPAVPSGHQQKNNGDGRQARSESRKVDQREKSRKARIAELETKIGDREQAIRDIEATMAAPGFYEDRDGARAIVARHTTLMWEVGELMEEWERLQLSTVSSSAEPS